MVLDIMKCLSDNTRLRIITLIHYRNAPICVGDVVESLDVPQYAISRHLKKMQEVELLQSFKKTPFTYYEINQYTFEHFSFLTKLADINLEEVTECKEYIQRMKNIK